MRKPNFRRGDRPEVAVIVDGKTYPVLTLNELNELNDATLYGGFQNKSQRDAYLRADWLAAIRAEIKYFHPLFWIEELSERDRLRASDLLSVLRNVPTTAQVGIFVPASLWSRIYDFLITERCSVYDALDEQDEPDDNDAPLAVNA